MPLSMEELPTAPIGTPSVPLVGPSARGQRQLLLGRNC